MMVQEGTRCEILIMSVIGTTVEMTEGGERGILDTKQDQDPDQDHLDTTTMREDIGRDQGLRIGKDTRMTEGIEIGVEIEVEKGKEKGKESVKGIEDILETHLQTS